MNVANSVVNQDNSNIRTMDTNSLLDLFNYTDEERAKKASYGASSGDSSSSSSQSPAKKQTMKELLSSLGELWDESQYETELSVDQFMLSVARNNSDQNPQ